MFKLFRRFTLTRVLGLIFYYGMITFAISLMTPQLEAHVIVGIVMLILIISVKVIVEHKLDFHQKDI